MPSRTSLAVLTAAAATATVAITAALASSSAGPSTALAPEREASASDSMATAPQPGPRGRVDFGYIPSGLTETAGRSSGTYGQVRLELRGGTAEQRHAMDVIVNYDLPSDFDIASAAAGLDGIERSTLTARGVTVHVASDPATASRLYTWRDRDGSVWQVATGSGLGRDELVRVMNNLSREA